MDFQLPQRRINVRQIQTQKRNIPLDQIIAVEGQNPIASGVTEASNVIGQTLAKRAALRQQGEQLAQLSKMAGEPIPTDNSLTPELYERGLNFQLANRKQKAEEDKNRMALEFQKEKLSQVNVGGTLVPSGLFDENGQPIMVNNKSGKSQTISLPQGTIGKTQTKTQLSPTSSTRSSGEFASTIIPHIADMKELIKEADAKGYIGPASGRIYNQFLAGKVGSTGDPSADYLLGKLRATDSLLKTGAMKAHFGSRGGQQMYEHFSELLNSGKQSAALLNGNLDSLQGFMQGYVDAGKGGLKSLPSPQPAAIPVESPAERKARLVQEAQGL